MRWEFVFERDFVADLTDRNLYNIVREPHGMNLTAAMPKVIVLLERTLGSVAPASNAFRHKDVTWTKYIRTWLGRSSEAK